jgi:prepilin-type N-terminal cleavage/methylation domain-containing protein
MKKNKSFTLIELLVVIVIIGILAGVIMISTSSSIQKANIAKVKVFNDSTRNSMMLDLLDEYNFDEVAGAIGQPLVDGVLVKDDWGSANLYTSGGPVLRSENDCISGKCLDFINDSATNLNRISRSDSMTFPSNFTISYWINKRGGCRYNGGIYQNYDGTGFMEMHDADNGNTLIYQGVTANRFVIYLFFTDSTSKQLQLTMDKNILDSWHLITFSYSDNTKYLNAYLDGNIFYNDTVELSKNIKTSNNANINIGKYTTYWAKGKVDEFRIYNTALSDAQIKQNYIAGLNSMLANGNISKEDYNERINNLAYEQE